MNASSSKNQIKALRKTSMGYILSRKLLNAEKLTASDNSTRFYTCFNVGRSNLDYLEDIERILNLYGLQINIHYRIDNDAPKGELKGNYIELINNL